MTQPHAVISENPRKEASTANWVAFVICTALLFDGYDLVIYGTVLPGLPASWGPGPSSVCSWAHWSAARSVTFSVGAG